MRKVKNVGVHFIVLLSIFMFVCLSVHAQDSGSVSGVIFDAETGQALVGTNVMLEGTLLGASTDENGAFEISNVPAGEYTLVASFMGYKSSNLEVTVTPGMDTKANVEMKSTIIYGEKVVVVGYATQQLRDVTGSLSTVGSEELNSVATTSVNQMLKGKAPGLIMNQRTAQPGGAVDVNIRGAISPEGNNTPLYVIDGVPITDYDSPVPSLNDSELGYYGGIDQDPLSYLNPSDIENITILKDASATAIYGSSAANGVLFINTKNGRSGDMQVQYRGSYTIQTPDDYFPMLNAKQFMQEQTRLSYDRHLWENNIAPYGTTDPSTAPTFIPLFSESEINAAGAGTDWFDQVMRTGYINEHTVSISGGNKNTRLYTSLNYQENKAILKNSTFKRYAVRVNLDQDLGDRVNLSLKSTVSRLSGNNASTGTNAGGAEKYNMIQAAFSYAPTVGVYDENGKFEYSYYRVTMNPAAFLTITDDGTTDHIFAAPNLTFKFSDRFKLNMVGQADLSRSSRGFYLPTIANHSQVMNGMAQKGDNRIENYTGEAYATYENNFKNSKLTMVLGAGYYETQSEGSSLTAQGFFTDAFKYNNVGVANDQLKTVITSFKSSRKKLSQFMRINFALHDKYLFSLVGRRDGSSIFAENKKYGFFPGASAAWRLSNERFMKSIKAISDLKLRLGYGQSGNESVLSGNTLQLYNPGYPALIGNTQYNGVTLSQVANPNLTWETNISINAGLDFGLFNDRIRGSVEYYQRTAKDLLDFNPLPANNAVGLVADNVGSTRSRGVELSLKTLNVVTDKFLWTSNLNVSTFKNTWVERNPQVTLASYIGEQDPIRAVYGFETDGIIKSSEDIPVHMPNADPGNLIYIDQNGDGILDIDDVVMIGNTDPDWSFGFNTYLSYRCFDLNIHVYGMLGVTRVNNFLPAVGSISQPVSPENTLIYSEDIWSSSNPNGTVPGVAANPYNGNNPTGNNDFNREEVDFIRLQTISLGYRLPNSIFRGGIGVQSVRVFLNLDNIGVFTNYSGYDPELAEANPYPQSYATTFGVEVNF
ncbi:SusC/RagA family TonB-linked outer membrane protein [bacterium]